MSESANDIGAKAIGSLERYVARAIDLASTPFQRLVFVGSLRDAYTGRYIHQGWSQVASAEEVDAMLDDFHRNVFRVVLRLSIIDLSKELRHHFGLLDQPEQPTSHLWLETEPFRDLIPRGCPTALRELFISQVRIALEVLCRAPNWSEIAGPVISDSTRSDRSASHSWLN